MKRQQSSKLTLSSTQIGSKGSPQQNINQKINNLLKIIQDYNHIKSEAIANLNIKVNRLTNEIANIKNNQINEDINDRDSTRRSKSIKSSYQAFRLNEDDN